MLQVCFTYTFDVGGRERPTPPRINNEASYVCVCVWIANNS
jgi:hypothetical protein